MYWTLLRSWCYLIVLLYVHDADCQANLFFSGMNNSYHRQQGLDNAHAATEVQAVAALFSAKYMAVTGGIIDRIVFADTWPTLLQQCQQNHVRQTYIVE